MPSIVCEECGEELVFISGLVRLVDFIAYCRKCDRRLRAMTELKDPKKWPTIQAELAALEAAEVKDAH